MRLCGVVEIFGKKYAFTRIENESKLAWYIYSNVAVINEKEYSLDVQSLKDFSVKSLQPFLLAASEISLAENRTYGNSYFISTINRALTKCINTTFTNVEDSNDRVDSMGLTYIYSFNGFSKDASFSYKRQTKESVLKTKDKESGDKKRKVVQNGIYVDLNFNIGDVKLTTLDCSTKSFNKGQQFDIKWEDFDMFSAKEIKFRDYNMSLKAKTLSQLRMTRDMSWYYNADGTTKKSYVCVDTLEHVKDLCTNVFPHVNFWALDIESTGLDMYETDDQSLADHIVSLMVAWKQDHALFFPFDMEYMKNLPEEAWEMLRPWLEKIPCGGHNIGFDGRSCYVKDGAHVPPEHPDETVLDGDTGYALNIPVVEQDMKLLKAQSLLAKKGIQIEIMHDTQILNFNINTYRAKYNNSLKFLEHKYLKVDTLELKDIFGTSKLAGLFRYLPKELALVYACPDVEQWLPLFDILYEMLPISGRKAYRLDMRTLKHIYKADAVGTRIDTLKAMELREYNNLDKEVLRDLAYRYVGQALAQKNYVDEIMYEIEEGVLTEDAAAEKLGSFFTSEKYLNAREEFNLNSGPKLAEIMYEKLGYPVLARSRDTNQPAVNAGALAELLKQKVEVVDGEGWLKKDIDTHMKKADPKEKVIIECSEFNKHAYPLPIIIAEYRLREKRDKTFYKAIIDRAIGGVYYTQSKMAGAETFRIINTIQVLQGVMKKLCIPRYEDWYMLVFDFSQIEYRHMGGLGKVKSLIKNLNRFRADFHVECCAMLHNIAAWTVTKAMRSAAKSINFAIPYGMGIMSIAMSLFKKCDDIAKIDATRQYNKWLDTFHEIKELLDKFREHAVEHGYVENELGRRRWFFNNEGEDTLENWKKNLPKGRKKAIERAAGNYPIQSGAADLFKIAFCQFRDRIEKEGLSEYIKTSALVHDEIQSSIHPDVNPYFLYKMIWEECMLQLKGHPRYFAGISIVDNWYEGKADLYEAPIEFVDYILKSGKADKKFVRYKDPKNAVLNDVRSFMKGVFIKEFKEVEVDCESNLIDVKHLLENLEDYFLRGKLPLYFEPRTEPNKDYENDAFILGLERFVLDLGLHDKVTFIYPDDYPLGTRAIISKDSRQFIDKTGDLLREVDTAIKSAIADGSLEFNLDLDLDLGDSLSLGDDMGLTLDFGSDSISGTLSALAMLEQDEQDSGIDDSFFGGPIYFCRPSSKKDDEYSDIDIYNLGDSDRINLYGFGDTRVKVELSRLVILIDDTSDEQRESLVDYLNDIAVEEDSLGAREVVFKLGLQYLYTGVSVGVYSLDNILNLLGVESGVNS